AHARPRAAAERPPLTRGRPSPRRGLTAVAVAVALLLIVGTLLLSSNPRHRAFYLGQVALGEVAARAGSASATAGGRSLRDAAPKPASLASSPAASPKSAAAAVRAAAPASVATPAPATTPAPVATPASPPSLPPS